MRVLVSRFMRMMAVITMLLIVKMAVVLAAFRSCGQPAIQIISRQLFYRGVRQSGTDFDALPLEQSKGAPPDTAGDDDVGALLTQPAREKARRMRRRHCRSDADNLLLLGVRFLQRELPATAEMSVQPAFGRGDGDGNHVFLLYLAVTDGAVATRIS